MNGTRSIGHLVIDEIHRQRMVSAQFDGHGYVFTWAGSAAEQLEALVEEHYVKKFTPPNEAEALANNIMAALKNADDLRTLSHRELIDKAMDCDAGDYDVVLELCNRLLPGWEK